ncbi:hypothetical protein CIB48_g1366 [Xylaria polymorpha]|nr:hypothetical protein CIB48_g1366 [Xylaria polymorpha]
MCLETSTTYGCGHWNTVVAPCRVRGTARCQLHKLPPRINTWYCSPACPGVSIWVPPPGFGWVPTMPNLQQTHGRTPAFPGFPQPLPDVPTRNVTELNASSRFEQACNMSAAEMQLYYTATHGMLIQDAQAPYTPFPNASNTFTSMYPSTASYGPTTQCLTTRWQPFEPPTYRPMFSQTGLASAHGVPSKVSAANKEAESAYKSSVPVAQMYEKGQKTLSECMMEKSLPSVKVSQGAKEYLNGAASVTDARYLMTARSSRSSASSETLTSGGGHDTIGSNSDEDNSYSAEYPMNGADGVIDIPTLDRANGFYMTGVDYKNSLHIDDKTGRFHLGSQWQVPSSKAAQSTAGSKFGAASIWTEWTQPRLSSTMRPSPPPGLNTALPDEVMTGRMQNLDLAKMHEPLPGRSDGRMREGSQHYGSGAQYKATPAPLVNYYDYADFETEEDCFFS